MHCCLSSNCVLLDVEAWKCENFLSWHGFLDPILRGLFQRCSWTQITPFQNKKPCFAMFSTAPELEWVIAVLMFPNTPFFYPPHGGTAHHPHGWWLSAASPAAQLVPAPGSSRGAGGTSLEGMWCDEPPSRTSSIGCGGVGGGQQEMSGLREIQMELRSRWI